MANTQNSEMHTSPNVQILMDHLGGFDMRDFDADRLAAIANAADNIKQQAITGLQVLGRLSADLADSGGTGNYQWACVGDLTVFLADIVEVCDLIEANATYRAANPEVRP